MKPSRELLVALDRMYNAPDFRTFREWVRKLAGEAEHTAVFCESNVDVMRGRAQALAELSALIEGSTEALKRLEKRHGTKA